MKTLEHDLKAQPRLPLPPDWKADILANVALDDSQSHEGTLRWLLPLWLRYGIAAIWILSLSFHLMTPPSGSAISHDDASPVPSHLRANHWMLALRTYQELDHAY